MKSHVRGKEERGKGEDGTRERAQKTTEAKTLLCTSQSSTWAAPLP